MGSFCVIETQWPLIPSIPHEKLTGSCTTITIIPAGIAIICMTLSKFYQSQNLKRRNFEFQFSNHQSAVLRVNSNYLKTAWCKFYLYLLTLNWVSQKFSCIQEQLNFGLLLPVNLKASLYSSSTQNIILTTNNAAIGLPLRREVLAAPASLDSFWFGAKLKTVSLILLIRSSFYSSVVFLSHREIRRDYFSGPTVGTVAHAAGGLVQSKF